jgi:hypothetical protein
MTIFFSFVVYYLLFLTYTCEFAGDRIISRGIYKNMAIYCGNRKFIVRALVDTGNRLVDRGSGAPVCIISLTVFLAMFPAELPEGHFINYSTISGGGRKIFVFAPEKLEIVGGKVTVNVRLGVAMEEFGSVTKYEALLNMGVL